MVFHCLNCELENTYQKSILFQVQSINSKDANLDAIISSPNDLVSLKLEELNITEYSQYIAMESNGTSVGLKTVKLNDWEGAEEILEDQQIKSSAFYKISIVNKANTKNVKSTFTLRISITEIAYRSEQNKIKEYLPKSINDIQRFKMKAEGLKESEFLMGTKFMMNYMNELALKPFIPKTNSTF